MHRCPSARSQLVTARQLARRCVEVVNRAGTDTTAETTLTLHAPANHNQLSSAQLLPSTSLLLEESVWQELDDSNMLPTTPYVSSHMVAYLASTRREPKMSKYRRSGQIFEETESAQKSKRTRAGSLFFCFGLDRTVHLCNYQHKRRYFPP
jgi:hypothetical protein